MKIIEYTATFKKQLKKVSQYPSFNKKKLEKAINDLANGQKLPANYKDHKLSDVSPEWLRRLRDFHLSPNIVVIYGIDENKVTLVAIGSHQNLGLTDSWDDFTGYYDAYDDYDEAGYNPYLGCNDFDC